ncbi:MAG: WYL domain-containing protein [Lachnospiraceae bacterium]|nr:WYL domain-containing protein [Lachnospiraceae bacterium]
MSGKDCGRRKSIWTGSGISGNSCLSCVREENLDKHNANLLILRILQHYTDEEHHLTQQDILQILKKDYDMEVDRRTVRSNLDYLIDLGYDILFDNGWYLASRDLEDAELRMLIDSVLFSNNLSAQQARTLIEKLRSMGSRYFSAKVNHVAMLSEMHHSDNKQILYSMDLISDAIDEGKKIRFCGCHYGIDFKMHKSSEHVVSPYQMAASNGRFYLICHDGRHPEQTVVYYRLDRMTDVEMLDEPREELIGPDGKKQKLDLPRHMAEHVYMFPGASVPIRIRAAKWMMENLIDWFGKDFRILEQSGDDLIVRLYCSEDAFFYWALQYGGGVEVLEPAALRERLREAAVRLVEKYS